MLLEQARCSPGHDDEVGKTTGDEPIEYDLGNAPTRPKVRAPSRDALPPQHELRLRVAQDEVGRYTREIEERRELRVAQIERPVHAGVPSSPLLMFIFLWKLRATATSADPCTGARRTSTEARTDSPLGADRGQSSGARGPPR